MSSPTNQERQLENIKQVVSLVEPDFNTLAQIHGAVNFKKEASFAMQILKANSYLMGIATGDMDSLKSAILNVAAIGLSLSPVQKLAYLVPRNKKVCLDISYRGYIQLGVDAGSIKWAHAEVVYEKDTFQLRGLGVEPLHEFQPFGDRGSIVGAYCVSKTHDGDYLTTIMSLPEIHAIRDRSESWKAYKRDNTKTNPWLTDEAEMLKKTVIRRAYKSWPLTDTRQRQRLDEAIDVADNNDPIDVTAEKVEVTHGDEPSSKVPLLIELLNQTGRTEEKFIKHLERVFKRSLKSLDELTETEMNHAQSFLESILKKEKPSENAS